MLSASLHRNAKLMQGPSEDISSSEFGEDYECSLSDTTTLHSTPSHLPSSGLKRRSCLKKGGDNPTRRAPRRTASADQLSFQVRLPGKPKPIVRTRSITFDESVRVRRVPSITELSDGRTNDLWFHSQEYNAIKRKTFSLIRAVQNGETAGVNYCTRGLEKYFDAERVQQTRAAALESVLNIQEGQRRSGSYDDLGLSRVYKSISSQSLSEAAKRGQMDHESIERYLQKTKQVVRSLSHAGFDRTAR
jgi:hypothetical protein